MYDEIYEDSENAVNLPDLWVENPSGTWDGKPQPLFARISPVIGQIPFGPQRMRAQIEARWNNVLRNDRGGEQKEKLVPAVWHGICEGSIDRVWMPSHHCCSGRVATEESEIVIDSCRNRDGDILGRFRDHRCRKR